MVALFFVAASLLGFLFTPKTDVIKESGISGESFTVVHAANAASVVNNNTLLNAPSSALLFPTINENSGSLILPSAPEFLSLGEIKDPGMLANTAMDQPKNTASGFRRPSADDYGMAPRSLSVIF